MNDKRVASLKAAPAAWKSLGFGVNCTNSLCHLRRLFEHFGDLGSSSVPAQIVERECDFVRNEGSLEDLGGFFEGPAFHALLLVGLLV